MRRAVFSRVTAIAIVAWCVAMLGTSLAQQAKTSLAQNTKEYLKLQEEGANFYDIQRAFNQYWEGRTPEKGQGWTVFKRWENNMAPRVYPSGILPEPDQEVRAFQQYLQRHGALMKGAATPASIATAIPSANWTPLGPTSVVINSGQNPGIGRISAIAYHPTDANTIFLGTPAGGLWKTTDGGATWSTNTDNLPVLGISGIAIDPSNPNIMYIGTGDPDGSDTKSLGVLKSTDGGATWNTTGLNWQVTQSRTMYKLLMHPTNSNILLAATSYSIWKTTDAGVTWTRKLIVPGSYVRTVKDIEFKPSAPNTVYAMTTANGVSEFWRSTDTGETWTQITAGGVPTTANRMNIGVTPANPNYVYLLASSAANSGFLGFYRSTDSGVSFTTRSTTPNILANDPTGVGGQGSYDLALAISPTHPDSLFAAGVGVYSSGNGGVTWNLRSYWLYSANPASWVHSDVHLLDFNGSTLYYGTDGGFFKSTNGGVSVTDLTAGMQITQYVKLGSYAGNANLIYAAAQDNGTTRYSGAMANWGKVLGGDGAEAIVDPTNPNIVYASVVNGSLNRSTNGATSGPSSIKNNINETGAWVTPFVMDPVSNTTLYAGFVNVWKTTNSTASPASAVSWTNLSNGSVGTGTFVDLQVAPSNSQYIYGVKSTKVYKTTNGGTTWSDITAGLPTASYTQIAVASNNPNKIWLTLSGYLSGNKVWASNDGGATWSNYSGTLPNLPFNTIVYHNNGGTDALYAGADIGVYYRDATMSDWELYQTGLPNVVIRELEVHPNSGKLRAATYGRGLWQADLVPPPGAALAFDGTDDYVSRTLPSKTSVTIESWVKFSGSTASQEVLTFSGSTPNLSFSERFYTDASGHFVAYMWDGSVKIVTSTTVAASNTWYHLALVAQEFGQLKLYVNGVEEGTAASLGDTEDTPILFLGWGPSAYFNGSLDDVRIWNVVRSATDIQNNMNCELNGSPAGLVAYYKCNQGLGGQNNTSITSLTDASSNAIHGTLNNFALTGATSNFVAPGGVTIGTTCGATAMLIAHGGQDHPHSGGATKLNGFASGGNGGYMYAWAVESGPNTGSEQFSSAISPTTIFKPAAKGNYVLRFTAKDAMNAIATDNVAVTVNALASASISGDDPVNPGSTHTYTVTTDASNPSYLWIVTNGTVAGDNDQAFVEVEAGQPNLPMLVEVYVTDGNTNDVTYAFKSVTVTYPFALTADAGPDRTIVVGGSVTIGGSPTAIGGIEPITYEWSPATGLNDATVANPVASPAATTTYLVTVKDGYEVIATDEMTVTVNPLVVKPFVFVGNKVTLKSTKQTTPAGNIHSNGLLTVEKGYPSTYNSNLTAIGKITINKQNTINGNVKSQTSISNSGTITGTKTIGAVNNEPLPSLTYSAGGSNKTVPNGGALALAPGSYGIVTLNSGGTLKLTSGDYYMNELRNSTTANNSVIEIDLSSGNPVTINIVTNFQFGNEAAIRLLPNGESDSKLVTFNTKQTTAANWGREGYMLGNFNAPNAIVTLVKNSQLRGTICAKELVVSNDCLFLHHDSPGTLPGPGNLPKTAGEVYEVASDQSAVTSYQLEQNYPNPFNPETGIRFALPEASTVSVVIYSLSGQIVKALVNGTYATGRHQVIWNGRDEAGVAVAGGIYFYRLIVQGENGEAKFTQTRKMTFVK